MKHNILSQMVSKIGLNIPTPTTDDVKSLLLSSTELFDTMTHDEMRKIAKSAGITCGKNRPETLLNLLDGIKAGKIMFKTVCHIHIPSDNGNKRTIFVKKLRTYKPHKVIMAAQ
jgi:hypothetical protein